MRLLSSQAKQRIGPMKYKKPWTNSFKTWREAEAKLRDMCESNSAQAQQLAASLQRSELEHWQLHTANERRLQFEAKTLQMSQDMEHQALSIAHQREQEVQQLGDQSEVQPDHLKA